MDQRFEPFAHLVTPNAELYRNVIATFVAAKLRFAVHLRPEDVKSAIANARSAPTEATPSTRPSTTESAASIADLDTITIALNKLVEWGNLQADPDTGRVTTVEDFHRARFLYRLTQPGEAVEQALDTFAATLGRRGALQGVALSDIVGQLRTLEAELGSSSPDPAKCHLALLQLQGRFRDLADNAHAFMGSLQRTIDLRDVEVDAFVTYRDRLIDYLERFVKDLVTTGAEIAALLERMAPPDIDRLLSTAAERDAADAAPDATSVTKATSPSEAVGDGARAATEPSPKTGQESDSESGRPDADWQQRAFDNSLALWRDRWRGLRDWFLSEPDRPSQSKLLRGRALSAIPELLHVVSALNDRRSRRSDRSADFRTLARWFAEAPGETATHRLWRSAFGLHSARHLTTTPETLAAFAERPVPASTPWRNAPPLVISPQLRRTGNFERRGKPTRVIDRAQQRRYLQLRAADEAQEIATARALLVTDGPIRLSEIGDLPVASFHLFLALLGDALTARRPNRGAVVATSSDGSIEIRLTPLDSDTRAEIRTPDGVFRGRDHVVEIADLLAPTVAPLEPVVQEPRALEPRVQEPRQAQHTA